MLREHVVSDMQIVSHQISNLINTPIEQNFERLARLAKRMFNVPVIAISLFDEKRQWVKPVVALDFCELNLYTPFFNEFNDDDILVVEDATKNERFKHHALVTQDPKIRFIVSFPIFEKNGKKVGSLIILDYKPRSFGSTDLASLNDIVTLIEAEISDFRLSKAQKRLLQELSNTERTQFIDTKTRAWNYEGCKKILKYQIIESQKDNSPFALAMIDIDHLRDINKKHGNQIGDSVLTLISRTILRSCRDEDTIARGDEEDFIVIIHANNIENVETVINRIKSNIAKEDIKLPKGSLHFNVTIGVTFVQDPNSSAEAILQNAQIALLKGKRFGRDCIQFN